MNAVAQNPKNEALMNLVGKLETRNLAKRDFIVPAPKVTWQGGEIMFETQPNAAEFFKPTELFETQIAEKLGIPMPYFRKMKQQTPELLAQNVNGWLQYNGRNKYLVRSISGDNNTNTARAFLSDSYSIIDDYDVLFAALEAIKNTGVNVEIIPFPAASFSFRYSF